MDSRIVSHRVPPLHIEIDEGRGKYRLDFYLDWVLYRMVRNIVGTILALSCDRLLMQDTQALFDGSMTRSADTAQSLEERSIKAIADMTTMFH